jgi:hydroxymethylbilane synthase
VPLGAYAVPHAEGLWLRGFVASPDGERMARAEFTGAASEPEVLGLKLAAELRAQGADAILAELGQAPAA